LLSDVIARLQSLLFSTTNGPT